MVTKKYNFKKCSLEKIFLVGLLVVFNILIIAFLVFSNIRVYFQSREIKDRYVSINKEIRELENKNQKLREMFSFFSEDGYSEAYLREKGMYQKEGEHVVVIQRDSAFDQKNSIQNFETSKITASLLDKIKNFFQNIFR